MSDQAGELSEITARLEHAAERLRAGEVGSEEAAALLEECARLAGDAVAELERRVRAIEGRAGGPPPQAAPPS